MARASKPGDTSYNARRRYIRAAERYMKKAEMSSGVTAERYRHLATQQLKSAMNTYDKSTTQKISKPIQNLADRLGVNIGQQRQNLKSMSDESARELQKRAIQGSTKQLASVKFEEGIETRRQAEARAILTNDAIGSRILGGTVSIWKEKAVFDGKIDKSKILPALYEYFKVDNLADLLTRIESMVGEMLYADADSDAMYETVKLTIQTASKNDNTVTQ